MTTPTLPAERWIGLWSPEPMRRLVDGFATAVALSGDTAKITDYDAIAASILPFLAWQNHAVAYNPGGSESQRREALRCGRELNRLTGTEGAVNLLGEINFSDMMLRYLPETDEGTAYPRHKNVDVDVIQPPGEAVGPELQEYLRRAIDAALPFTLQLRRVNLIGVITITEKDYLHVRGTARGWIVATPEGNEQWL